MYKHGSHKVTLNETIYRSKGEKAMSQHELFEKL